MYSDKYIKTEIKIYNDIVYTNFQRNKIRKDNEHCACLPLMLLILFLLIQTKNIIIRYF